MSILYISYDGIMEPLGKSQVFYYLNRISLEKPIHLISFEKKEDLNNLYEFRLLQSEISKSNIVWHPLQYHKRPSTLATAWDILCGFSLGFWLVNRHRLLVVHARSYVPSVMALALKRLTFVRFLFDMRGFWADERVECGLWVKQGYLFKIAKWLEQYFLLSADHVVVLSNVAALEIKELPYLKNHVLHLDVIYTCADLNLFKPKNLNKTKSNNRPFTLGHVGSVGVSYLFEETLRCFKLLKELLPDARLHIINKGDHSYILQRLKLNLIDLNSIRLEETDHAGVVRGMKEMDAGIFFIKQVYSKKASTPTKLGEFLACGIPCLSNAGVGDMTQILESESVGIIIRDFNKMEMNKAITNLIQLTEQSGISHKCRKVAEKYFSLNIGVQRYENIYNRLLSINE
jgi:glycosyltransferase involved in cell wall biosynthesis